MNSAYNQSLLKNQPEYSCSLPINYQDFWIINSKGIDYYMIDLKNTDINIVMDIIDECDIVEKACWQAQENFYDYIQKCDMLSYAVINDRIVGFCAGTLFFMTQSVYTAMMKPWCSESFAIAISPETWYSLICVGV